MTRIVGVRFKRAGRIYYFDPGEHQGFVAAADHDPAGTRPGKVREDPGRRHLDVVAAHVAQVDRVAAGTATKTDGDAQLPAGGGWRGGAGGGRSG